MSIKKRNILIVTEEQPSSHGIIIEQTFKFLAALWKIDVDNRDLDHVGLMAPKYSYSMIVFAFAPSTIDAQQWKHLARFSGKVPILGFYSSRSISNSLTEHIWGVDAFSRISGDLPIEVKSNQKHPYTHNLPSKSTVKNPKQCSHASISVSGDIQKLIYNEDVTLVCAKGLNVFFGVDIRQLGMLSFKPFFKLIENIFFHVDSGPHLSPGGYAAVRVDDFPTCTSEYLHAWNHRSRAFKRILLGLLQLSPFQGTFQKVLLVF